MFAVDELLENGVFRGIAPVERCSDYANGPAARVDGPLMSRCVDTIREAADDNYLPLGELGGQLRGSPAPLSAGLARAHDGDADGCLQ